MAQTSEFFTGYGLAALDASDPLQIRLFTQRAGVEVRVGANFTRAQVDALDQVLPWLPEAGRIAYIDVSGDKRVIVKAL